MQATQKIESPVAPRAEIGGALSGQASESPVRRNKRVTLSDHECYLCRKIIPKGTPTSEIVIEAAGGRVPHYHTCGSHHDAYSYWGYRHYFHKDCYIAYQLCGKKDPLRGSFHVYRNTLDVTYCIGYQYYIKNEFADFKRWNKAVEKSNKIYYFALRNGFDPDDLLKLQTVDRIGR